MDLKQLREKAGLRILDVASRLDIAESTVRNWEHGRSIPKLSPVQVCELLNLYGCTVSQWRDAYLLTRER